MSAAIKISLPVGLAVLYGVGVVIWYELLRSQLVDLVRRRRGRAERAHRHESRVVAVDRSRWERPDVEESEGGAPRHDGTEASADDPPAHDPSADDSQRSHYLLARDAAKGERDAAIEAAKEATRQTIDRIEQRYGSGESAGGEATGRAALTEREAAVEAANAATRQAVERIERRYREIDWALEDEEAERIERMLHQR